MNPFWDNIYDDAKDRRYGALFFTTLLGCFLSLLIGALVAAIKQSDFLDEYGQVLLLVGGIPALLLIWSVIKWGRARKWRQEHLKYSALSRDELAKARSKLKYQMKPAGFKRQLTSAKRVPPRAPDINLKY